jgi:hypothetical protein
MVYFEPMFAHPTNPNRLPAVANRDVAIAIIITGIWA